MQKTKGGAHPALVGGVLALLAGVFALCVATSSSDSPRFVDSTAGPTSKSTSSPTSARTKKSKSKYECIPDRDLGCGTPDAKCATNRLNKFFIIDGKGYMCSGPRPFRWRLQPHGAGDKRYEMPAGSKYDNCTAMRSDYPGGVSDLHSSYEKRLDRDKDGQACETD
jgi:hypothetical protein